MVVEVYIMKTTHYRITALGITMPIAHGIVCLVLKRSGRSCGNFHKKLPIGDKLCDVSIQWANGVCRCAIAD